MTTEQRQLERWLVESGLEVVDIEALPGDVSCRRYFRLYRDDGRTLIAGCYPQDMRSVCQRFAQTSGLLTGVGARVPKIATADCSRGLMLLEDVGSISLYDLDGRPWDDLEPLLSQGLEHLRRIQTLSPDAVSSINPPLDAKTLGDEMDLAWKRVLNRPEVSGPPSLRRRLRGALDDLGHQLATAPLVPCHRDYMARNLMVDAATTEIVVIDHQDLRLGPKLYDLASLLNDSLFPPPDVEHRLRDSFTTDEEDLLLYRRCVVQRCLKAAETFVRFAGLGNLRHLPLVRPSLARAAEQLQNLPEGGGGLGPELASYWLTWQPGDLAGETAEEC